MEEHEQGNGAAEKTVARKAYFKQRFSAKNITYFAILVALEVVLQLWGSSISIGGGATLNFSLIPIVLGAMLLGPLVGGLLGLVCGIMVLVAVIQGLNGAVFLYLFNEQPVVISLICLLKTTAAGVVAGFIYKALSKKSKRAAVIVSTLSAPIVNTGLFVIGCMVMPGTLQAAITQLGISGYSSIYALIFIGFVGFNFFIEFGINLVLAPGLYTVVKVVEKQILKKG